MPSHENEEQPLSGPAGLTPTQEATIPVKFDSQTLERFRRMTPQEIYREVTDALHQAPGGAASEDFLDTLDSLVGEGILSWDQIQNFESEEED